MRVSPLRVRRMVWKEFVQIFRDPKLRAIVFVSPLLQLLAFGYAVSTDVEDAAMFVVDLDKSFAARRLRDALTVSGSFRIVGESDDPADLVRALDRARAILGVHIPAGFARDMTQAGGAVVQLIVDGSNSNTASAVQADAGEIVRQVALGAARERGELPAAGIELRPRAWYNADLSSRVYNVPAVIGVVILLMCLLLTSLSVVREREVGTLDQLVVTPLTPRELMLGKTVPIALIALVDLVLVTAVAILWFGIPFRGSLVALTAAAVLFILSGLAIGLLISTVSSTQQEAFMVMFLIFLPAVILSGFMFPVSSMPAVFEWLTLLNPVRHFLEIVRGIFLKGHDITDRWIQYLALAAMAAAALGLATIRFRKSLG